MYVKEVARTEAEGRDVVLEGKLSKNSSGEYTHMPLCV